MWIVRRRQKVTYANMPVESPKISSESRDQQGPTVKGFVINLYRRRTVQIVTIVFHPIPTALQLDTNKLIFHGESALNLPERTLLTVPCYLILPLPLSHTGSVRLSSVRPSHKYVCKWHKLLRYCGRSEREDNDPTFRRKPT